VDDSFLERFLDAVLSGDRRTALRVVDDALESGASQIDIYSELFAASLRRVGDLWEANDISAIQDRIATGTTRAAISASYVRFPRAPIECGTLVVTGVAGELHQIGGSLFADCMDAGGWDVRFLGTDLPNAEIVEAVEACSANVLAITTTLVSQVPVVVELVRDVRARMGDRAPKIILGGLAYRDLPNIVRKVGAIGAFTDLRAAVEALS